MLKMPPRVSRTLLSTRIAQDLVPKSTHRVPAPWVCTACRTRLDRPNLPDDTQSLSRRAFSSSATQWKKGGKDKRVNTSKDDAVPDNVAQKNRNDEIDPYDFTELQAEIDKALDRFKDALQKVKGAGRLTPEIVEALPVMIKEKDSTGKVKKEVKLKVGDVAVTVPKGRNMLVIVNEEDVRYRRSQDLKGLAN